MPNTWGSTKRQVVVWIVGLTAIGLAVTSIGLSLRSQYWYPRVYAFWIIAPPSWFFIEYHFVFNRKDDPHAIEQIKIGQDVAQKFWAALLVLLAGIGVFQWHLSLH
jgi:hypothetical protein